MVAKVLFLVLLGTALVMANSEIKQKVDVKTKVELSESQERSIEEVWENLKQKFSRACEMVKATWQKIKEKSEKIANENFKPIKERGMRLIEQAKELYKQIVAEGKAAEPEVEDIKASLKELVSDMKKNGNEAFEDAKQLVHEVVQTVTGKLDAEKVGVVVGTKVDVNVKSNANAESNSYANSDASSKA